MSEVLRALVETVLALGHPDFPALPVDHLVERVRAFCPVDDEQLERFADLPRFRDLDPAAYGAEQALLSGDGVPPESIDGIIAERAATDARRFEELVCAGDPGARFERASLAARRAYLRLWAQSALSARRRLYVGLKAAVLIPAYSLPALRRAIGDPHA